MKRIRPGQGGTPDHPKTEAQLWDWMQPKWGFGDWDEVVLEWEGGLPWWKWRITEQAKLRQSLKKHGISVEEMFQTASYCLREGIQVAHWMDFYRYTVEATRDLQVRKRAEDALKLEENIERAVQWETTYEEDSPWIARLIRAQGEQRAKVYESWKAERGALVFAKHNASARRASTRATTVRGTPTSRARRSTGRRRSAG